MKSVCFLNPRIGTLLVAQTVPATCFAEGVLYFDIGGFFSGFVLYLLGLAALVAVARSATSRARVTLSSVVLCYLLAPFLYAGWSVHEKNSRTKQIEEQQQRNLEETHDILVKFCREYKGDAVPSCRNRQ